MAVKIPLSLKLSIKVATAKNEGYLKEINTLLGTEWTLDMDYPQLYETLLENEHDKLYADNVGIMSTGYFSSFRYNLKNMLDKDEDYKEALVDEITAKKIVFKLIETDEFDYCKAAVEDGALVFNIKKGTFTTHREYLGQGLEKEL